MEEPISKEELKDLLEYINSCIERMDEQQFKELTALIDLHKEK